MILLGSCVAESTSYFHLGATLTALQCVRSPELYDPLEAALAITRSATASLQVLGGAILTHAPCLLTGCPAMSMRLQCYGHSVMMSIAFSLDLIFIVVIITDQRIRSRPSIQTYFSQ